MISPLDRRRYPRARYPRGDKARYGCRRATCQHDRQRRPRGTHPLGHCHRVPDRQRSAQEQEDSHGQTAGPAVPGAVGETGTGGENTQEIPGEMASRDPFI